jgi:hypothetical protein
VAHAAVKKWCAEREHQRLDICWEVYGHWLEDWNADPAKIRTDIFYLVDDPKT